MESYISGNKAHRYIKADRQKQTGTQTHLKTQRNLTTCIYNSYSYENDKLVHLIHFIAKKHHRYATNNLPNVELSYYHMTTMAA